MVESFKRYQIKPEKCYVKFPFIGKVTAIKKGYFFLQSKGDRCDVHADASGSIRNAGFYSLKQGDICLFNIEVTLNDKKTHAIEWIAVNDVSWGNSAPLTQSAYDSERKAYKQWILERLRTTDLTSSNFRSLSLEYRRLSDWNEEVDSFESIIKEKLKDAAVFLGDFRLKCQAVSDLSEDFDSLKWEILPAIEWVESPCLNDGIGYQVVKETFGEEFLSTLIRRPDLSNDLIDFLLAEIEKIIYKNTLVFDLEASPDRVYEVGWCFGQQEKGGGKELLPKLAQEATKAQLIVGHNILAWDLERLKQHGCSIAEGKPVWDTLLISFLMHPDKTSFALGGEHTALDDSRKCRDLFIDQVKEVGASTAFEIIKKYDGTNLAGFYHDICSCLQKFEPKKLPNWFNHDWKRVAVPDAWVSDLFWIPEIAVGQSRGFLEYNQIDCLIESNSIAAIVLGYVLKRASKAGVILHECMIPLWMKEDSEIIQNFINNSKCNSSRDKNKRVMPFSCLSEEHLSSLDSMYSAVGGKSSQYFLLQTWERDKPENSSDNFIVEDSYCDAINKQALWRVSKRFCLDSHIFHALPEVHVEPIITRWNMPFLFPNSKDIQEYWVECIGRFLSVTRDVNQAVPVFFVDAEGMYNRIGEKDIELVEMIEGALLSLGKKPYFKTFHSKLRRLQIARENRKFLVAPMNQLHEWIELSVAFNIPIMPVIERIPLENWWLLKRSAESLEDETNEDVATEGSGSEDEDENNGDSPSDIDDDPVAVGADSSSTSGKILRDATKLAQCFLKNWLTEIGGPNAGLCPYLIIDSRVQSFHPDNVRDFSFVQTNMDRETLRYNLSDLAPLERKEPSDNIEDLKKFVRERFFNNANFEDFYDYQKEAVSEIILRKPSLSLLVRLPTGAGKSLIFQAPALFRGFATKKLTLIVSPLKALMHDQVNGLWKNKNGFEYDVDYLSSDRPWWESTQVIQGVMDHRICMLYVAPERLRNREFMSALERRIERDDGLEYLVFDEAHCISLWGHEFRPDYLFAAKKLTELRDRGNGAKRFPVLMFSATVPDITRDSIRKALGLEEHGLTLIPAQPKDPIREEIQIQPNIVQGTILDFKEDAWVMEPRIEVIVQAIAQVKEGSAVIIFVQRRAHAEILTAKLQDSMGEGFVDYFHAGMPTALRQDVYDRYSSGSLKVLVATKAFGMGMDIPHIHQAIHLSSSTYLEDYLQEVGRIGRDKKLMDQLHIESLPAQLLFSDEDFDLSHSMSQKSKLRPGDVDDFWSNIVKQSQSADDGRVLLALPVAGTPDLPAYFQKGKESGRSTKVRMALHWLEQADRVVIDRMLPAILNVQINAMEIDRIANDQEAEADVRKIAEALNALVGGSNSSAHPGTIRKGQEQSDHHESVLSKVFDAVNSFIGFVFGSNSSKTKDSVDTRIADKMVGKVAGEPWQKAMLEMDALGKQSGLLPDDVLTAIFRLYQENSLEIETELNFSCGNLLKAKVIEYHDGKTLLTWLSNSWRTALDGLNGQNGQVLDWDSMGLDFQDAPSEKTIWMRSQEKALLKIMRLAGGHLQRIEQADDSGRWRVRFKRPTDRKRKYCERVVKLAEEIWDQVGNDVTSAARNKETCTVELSKLMACCDGTPGRRDLTTALDILSQLRLLHTNESLFPRAYFLELKKPNQPLNMDAIKEQIEAVNEMAELREWAMHTFCLISKQSHSRFIREYFNQGSPEKLRQFLMVFLGKESSEEKLSEADVKKIIQLREKIDPTYIKQQFDNVFDKHRAYEAQWKAITKAPDSHMLVNAGPGSGKTTVLIARIIYLIKESGIHPDEIMVLAFNRAVVHEIRQRTRDVFEKVGYGRYAKSLRVSTFHALAARNIDCADIFERPNILGNFNIQLNTGMAKSIAGNIKVILVDEFQDMNEYLFNILKKLQEANNAGVFAIGDDDQDILGFTREKGSRFATWFFEDFERTFKNHDSVVLTTNFRSDKMIVEQCQSKIQKWSSRNEIDFKRKKFGESLVSHSEENGVVDFIDVSIPNSDEVLDRMKSVIQNSGTNEIAILCQTNAEVAWWHEKLNPYFNNIAVQGRENYSIAMMRHVACWLDCVDEMIQDNKDKKKGDIKLDQGVWDQLYAKWKSIDIPETRMDINGSVPSIKVLWNIFLQESSYARLQDYKEFVELLKLDDYEYILQKNNRNISTFAGGQKLLLSTIHKVKGLEFEHVIVTPSWAGFSSPDIQPSQIKKAAAEEARLYYVAMTRAKHHLTCFIGPREDGWSKSQSFKVKEDSRVRIYLKGEVSDFYISWAAKKGRGDERQKIIESEITIGDSISVRGNELIEHKEDEIIGQLKGSHERDYGSDLKVTAVLRYMQTNEKYREGLCDNVTNRKPPWSWLVCVKGFYFSAHEN